MSYQKYTNSSGGGIAATLDASYYKGPGSRNGKEREFVAEQIEPVVYPGVGITSPQNGNNPLPGDPAPSVTTDSRNYMVKSDRKRKYIVRRLTPTECARLQGFPSIAEVDAREMTRDEIIMLCIAEQWIKANPATGEIYGIRGPGGIRLSEYKKLQGSKINGYICHTLNYFGIKKQVRAHRVVWMYVNGRVPDGYVIDHINNDKTDNRIENLQLLTPEQNSAKAKIDGLYPTGDESVSSRSTENDRQIISYLYWHTDTTCSRLANMFGLSKSRIQQIIHEYEWTDGADGSDSAKYKLWGNGIALPCAEDVIGRLAKELRRNECSE